MYHEIQSPYKHDCMIVLLPIRMIIMINPLLVGAWSIYAFSVINSHIQVPKSSAHFASFDYSIDIYGRILAIIHLNNSSYMYSSITVTVIVY